MFSTTPRAEIAMLREPNGTRVWSWVEFSLSAPFFLVTLEVDTEDGPFGQDLLFGTVDQVLKVVGSTNKSSRLETISLLSPGYLNRTGSYQLGRLRQIWIGKKNRTEQKYVLQDGTQFLFPPDNDKQEEDFELVFST